MKTIRDITVEECPWLNCAVIPKGMTVHKYYGRTYGCISPTGVPISFVEGKTPFIELPADSVE